MKAEATNIGKVFSGSGSVHYVLPRFQRAYAWEKEQWQTLWDDVMEVQSSPDDTTEHFLGAMVAIEEKSIDMNILTYTLVDGQQRLLTLSLMLCALAEQVEDDENFRNHIRSYLENRFGKGQSRYKIWPTRHYGDREVWAALVDGAALPKGTRSRLPQAMAFFRRAIQRAVARPGVTPRDLFSTLVSRLFLVFINLDREERPHYIFESLNAKGRPLTQPDLVRNYLAMRLPEAQQDDAYDRYWLPIQGLLDDQREGELSAFLRHYLARVMRKMVSEKDVYKEFRKRMDKEFDDQEALVDELRRLQRHAEFYDCLLRPEHEADAALRTRLEYINALQRKVVYPLLLSLQDAYDRHELSREDFCDALDLLENYLVRYYLAERYTGRKLGDMLLALIAEEEQQVSLRSLKDGLHRRQYQGDDQVRDILGRYSMAIGSANRPLFVHILLRVNRHLLQGRDVTITLRDKPSIEHIMPCNPSSVWQDELGEEWERVHQELLNMLGNLTLVTQGWNASASNRPWSEKKAQLARHGLPLNVHWFGSGRPGAGVRQWDQEAIKERGRWLINRILEVWPDHSDAPRKARNLDPNLHTDYKNTGATSLTLYGEETRIDHHAWNNCAVLFTNRVAVPRPDFAELADQASGIIQRNQGYKQLENGWWLKYMPSKQAARYLIDLAELCELADEDWHVTVKRY